MIQVNFFHNKILIGPEQYSKLFCAFCIFINPRTIPPPPLWSLSYKTFLADIIVIYDVIITLKSLALKKMEINTV
jgi:hypothetical protein